MSKHAKVINEATLLGCFLRNATHLSNYGKKTFLGSECDTFFQVMTEATLTTHLF